MSGPKASPRFKSAAFEPVRTGDLVSEVSKRILRAILDGQFAPGQRLTEAEVARQMEVSRAPVREAARRLEQRGLLVSKPRRGFFVRDLSLSEIDDLYGLRICLERYAARHACEHASDDDLARLAAQVELLRELAEQERTERDGRDFEEADLRFHQMLVGMSGNLRLARLFDDLADEIRIVITLIGRVYEDPTLIAETHRPVVTALMARDAEAVGAAIDYHIGDAWKQVRQLFESRSAGAQPAQQTGTGEIR